jgi:hypothetical protein
MYVCIHIIYIHTVETIQDQVSIHKYHPEQSDKKLIRATSCASRYREREMFSLWKGLGLGFRVLGLGFRV